MQCIKHNANCQIDLNIAKNGFNKKKIYAASRSHSVKVWSNGKMTSRPFAYVGLIYCINILTFCVCTQKQFKQIKTPPKWLEAEFFSVLKEKYL